MTDTIQITLPRDVAERYAEYASAVYETRSAVMDREDDRHSWRDLEDVGTIAHALTSALEATPASLNHIAQMAAEARSEARQMEGWEVYEGDRGPQIQAVQDQDLEGGVSLTTLTDPDLEAVAIVLRGAIAGKPHALSALEEIGYRAEVFGSLEAALEAVEFGLEPTTVNPSLEDALHESRLFLSDELDDKSEAQ